MLLGVCPAWGDAGSKGAQAAEGAGKAALGTRPGHRVSEGNELRLQAQCHQGAASAGHVPV